MRLARLLHVSDLHLATSTPLDVLETTLDWRFPPGLYALALEVAAMATSMSRHLDAILVTGDLTHHGTWPELAQAAAFVNAEPLPTRPTLKGAKLETALLPGNHDRYLNARGRPGNRLFDTYFRDHWDAPRGVQTGELIEDTLAVVCADFCLPEDTKLGPRKRAGRGRVRPEIIEELTEQTDRVRKTHAVFWASHFPPGDDLPSDLLLEDWELLVKAANDNGVDYILAGHIHEERVQLVTAVAGHQATVVCAPSACIPQGDPGVLIVEIGVDTTTNQIVHLESLKSAIGQAQHEI